MKVKLPIICALSLGLTGLTSLGCGNTHNMKATAEYEQFKADATLGRLMRLKNPDALTPDGQLQPDAVILSGTEYKQYQHDAKLLKEYKTMNRARMDALK